VARTITLESLLQEMIDRESLARWPRPPYTCRQASSDARRPEGCFANNGYSHFLRSEEHGGRREWVLLDAPGPGCVVRFWWGGPRPSEAGRLRFYLDGSDTPAIEAPPSALLGGIDSEWVGPPLAIENGQGPSGAPGGLNLFLPIPYAEHCKITWEEVNPQDPPVPPESRWYTLEYRTYPAGTPVETFSREALEKARPILGMVGRTLLEAPSTRMGREVLLRKGLPPKGQEGISLPRGPAAVRLLELRLETEEPSHLEQALRSTVLRMVFDGEETVWCPVGDFFGSGVGLNPLHNWTRTVSEEGFLTCRWVMPYQGSARVALLNLGRQGVQADLRVLVGPWAWDDRTMRFHANWHGQNRVPTRPSSDVGKLGRVDWNFLTVQGQGVYVGDTLSVFNPVPDGWGEGGEQIWVDEEPFPSHCGTGTEDYYGYSCGSTALFQGPFSNQVRCDGPGHQGHTVLTRTRVLDAIPFTRALRFDMEIRHRVECEVSYAAATYWYALGEVTHNREPQMEEAAAPIPQVPDPSPAFS